MNAYRLPNGNLMVPKRAEGEGLVGDAWFEVGPDDPDFKSWMAWYERMGQEPPDWPETPDE